MSATKRHREESLDSTKKQVKRNDASISDERREKLLLLAMAPYERHKLLVNTYLLTKPGDTKIFERDTSNDRTPFDALVEHHRFVWKASDSEISWEGRLAKRYYDMLFREYAICDLSQYKTGNVAMRWQTEKEVQTGKGQFICGSRKCHESAGLRTWEVPFRYQEQGEKRTELVKLRLCAACSKKLNYGHGKREVTKSRNKRLKEERKPAATDEVAEASTSEPRTRPSEVDEKPIVEKTEGSTNRASEDISAIWSAPAPASEEEGLSRDDEFQAYLEDLFL
ncbi:unnamed protein product [Notodromas monacha]|uniref:Protein FRA10AC1 n=1 Tax=Notodromas monacha TaxID=399045 RepID=A0A7R9BF90_9CRUS|nr:unnamed protein product [Notodromas monacha]CAG0913407.1 unnamed protein product [Notodromas monacha]